MNENDSKANNEIIIIFGVMRQNDGCIFNPKNELCGSIAFRNLASLSESLAICEGINEEIQANTKHHMQGESFIPIAFVEGNWYEIRRDVLLPYRVNEFARDEWFVNGLWSVETPPSPETILEFGAMRQVSEFGKKYQLVTSDQEIGDVLEGVGYKPSSSLSFNGIPSASIFVLKHEGEMKEVWGCYQAAPELNAGVELIWHDNMSDVELAELEECNPLFSVGDGESPSPTEQEQETEEEKYFSYSEKRTDKKNNEAEAALDEFMEALNSGNEEALTEIADEAFECFVFENVPKDNDKEALLS